MVKLILVRVISDFNSLLCIYNISVCIRYTTIQLTVRLHIIYVLEVDACIRIFKYYKIKKNV